MKIHTLLGLAFASLLSFTLHATEIPQEEIAEQKLNRMDCLDESNQRCSDVCMNSEEIDCQDKCKTLGQEKCEQELVE